MNSLAHKKAVITGGSEGIGFAIAKAYVANGADVILISRNPAKLSAARSQLEALAEREIHCLSADLSDHTALLDVAGQTLALWPELDILVNNAGIGLFTPFQEVSSNELEMLLNLNVKAPYFFSQQLLPALEQRRGTIINISSYFSHRMIPGRTSTAYSLTKGALDSFTKALASELGSRGIRVNAIAPGTVDTPLVQGVLARMPDDQARQFLEMIKTIYPLGHIGQPDDIAGAALYLASGSAKWVTGAIFNIDGGLTTN